MSEGSKWTPGKIFLLVIGVLAGLGILCCGAGYFFFGDAIKGAFSIGKDSIVFVERLQKDYGPNTVFQPIPSGNGKLIVAIGVEGDLTPERVTQIQDGAWKIFAEAYKEHGFAQVTNFGIGRPGKGRSGRGSVEDWQ